MAMHKYNFEEGCGLSTEELDYIYGSTKSKTVTKKELQSNNLIDIIENCFYIDSFKLKKHNGSSFVLKNKTKITIDIFIDYARISFEVKFLCYNPIKYNISFGLAELDFLENHIKKDHIMNLIQQAYVAIELKKQEYIDKLGVI